MDKRKVKFLAGSLIIVASIAWLGFSGFDESLAYYKTWMNSSDEGRCL
jgi:hypothetical protein